MSRRALRTAAALVVPCLLVLGLLGGTAWWNRAALRARLPRQQTEPALFTAIDRWASRPAPPGGIRAVLFGDSLGHCSGARGMQLSRGVLVGETLARRLADGGPKLNLLEIRHGAFRPLVYAYYLDDVLAGRPQLAVIEVNVGLFSDAATYPRAMRFSSLARRLPMRRAWRLREALARDELSLLDPLVYRLYDRLDTVNLLAGVEALGRDWLDGLGRAVNARLGPDPAAHDTTRLAAYVEILRQSARGHYHAEFAAHPASGVLREMRDALRGAGAVVLFYVSPIRIQALQWLGLLDEADLSARIERLRDAIGATPAEWVDLHSLVDDDSSFLDNSGHMYRPGCEQVAAALAPRVRALVATQPSR